MSNVIRVKLTGVHVPSGQELTNRFFYGKDDATDTTPEDLAAAALDFETDVVTAMTNQVSNEVRYEFVAIRNDALGQEHVRTFSPPITGSVAASCEPVYYSMKFFLRRGSPVMRSGNKFVSGYIATSFDSQGVPANPTVEAELSALAAGFLAKLDTDSAAQFAPLLVSKYVEATGTYATFTSVVAASYDGLTTQRSRKPKRTRL